MFPFQLCIEVHFNITMLQFKNRQDKESRNVKLYKNLKFFYNQLMYLDYYFYQYYIQLKVLKKILNSFLRYDTETVILDIVLRHDCI